MSDLDAVTEQLAKAYESWKSGEKAKNKLRDEFFDAVNTEIGGNSLAEKYASVNAPDEASARDRLKKQYPAWTVDEIRQGEDDLWEAVLIENPNFVSFTYVNKEIGVVFQKQVSSGSIYIDDERLAEEDPDLYEEVTYVPEPERQLKDLESLPPHILAKLADYIYEGKPTVKLAAPRKAKDEELE